MNMSGEVSIGSTIWSLPGFPWSIPVAVIVICSVRYWIIGRKFTSMSKLPTIGDLPFVGSTPFLKITSAPGNTNALV